MKTNMLKRGGRYYNFSEVVCGLIIAIRHEIITIDTGNRFMEAIVSQDWSKILPEEQEKWSSFLSGFGCFDRQWFNNRTLSERCPLLCGEYKKYSKYDCK
jgi:hypothetical protein